MRVPKSIKVVGVLVLVAAMVAGGVAYGWKTANNHSYTRRHQYPYLDLSVSNPEVHQEIINFDPLRQDIKKYLGDLKLSYGFYFEYLPNGISIRDNSENTSQAASLLKTPIVMDLYRLSELGKLNLDTSYAVKTSNLDTDANYGNTTGLKAGDELTLREAAKITLQNSDNTTLSFIKERVVPLLTKENDSFESLDIPITVTDRGTRNEAVTISARSYSSILKCLYYSCFNDPKDSSQMLEYLTGSAGEARLIAGIGTGIKVAHKIGSGENGTQSDCGIIYLPSKPYLVCLMFFDFKNTRAEADSYFEHVSSMIYDYVTASGNMGR